MHLLADVPYVLLTYVLAVGAVALLLSLETPFGLVLAVGLLALLALGLVELRRYMRRYVDETRDSERAKTDGTPIDPPGEPVEADPGQPMPGQPMAAEWGPDEWRAHRAELDRPASERNSERHGP